MAKKRGRGVLTGGVGYPGNKTVTTQNFTDPIVETLKRNEARLGVSKTALTIYAIRKAGLDTCSLAAIERDILRATRELEEQTTAKRAARWKPTLAD